MPENNITPELLAAKLAAVDEKFNTIHEILVRIEEQTKKTNGRVTAHDDKIKTLELDGLKHTISCPQISVIAGLKKDMDEKFGKIDNDLSEYRIVKKYPQAGLVILVVACVALFVTTYVGWRGFTEKLQKEIKATYSEQIK
jgi:hypothetical protein